MTADVPETCAECGFDGRDWRVRDAVTLFDALGYWWRLATAGVRDDDLNRRPAPGVWSALEYGLHTSLVTAVIRSGIEVILDDDGVALPAVTAPDADPENALVLDRRTVLDALEREGRAMAAVGARRDAAWANAGTVGAYRYTAESALVHAVHDASHHFMDIARGLAALGAAARTSSGTVAQLNASDGGVPKQPVERAAIGRRGMEGDHQADRKHHGRPFQALSLWSSEVIAELASHGHPIAAGYAGENVTVAGVDWATLRPGTRLRVGSALVELSYPAVPCQKQTKWFTDGDFNRISYDRNPQWVRWYGWVREPGTVATGDPVTVTP